MTRKRVNTPYAQAMHDAQTRVHARICGKRAQTRVQTRVSASCANTRSARTREPARAAARLNRRAPLDTMAPKRVVSKQPPPAEHAAAGTPPPLARPRIAPPAAVPKGGAERQQQQQQRAPATPRSTHSEGSGTTVRTPRPLGKLAMGDAGQASKAELLEMFREAASMNSLSLQEILDGSAEVQDAVMEGMATAKAAEAEAQGAEAELAEQLSAAAAPTPPAAVPAAAPADAASEYAGCAAKV